MVAQGTTREWIEYPIDPGHRERSQGLDFHGPENHQEVVVECATKLGFSVHDDQAARLYLRRSGLGPGYRMVCTSR